jgi:hypothetical protein
MRVVVSATCFFLLSSSLRVPFFVINGRVQQDATIQYYAILVVNIII